MVVAEMDGGIQLGPASRNTSIPTPLGTVPATPDQRLARLQFCSALVSAHQARLINRARRRYGRRAVVRRLFDVTVASSALIATLPLMAVVAVIVRATSRGPILFRQTRVGIHGALFTCLKFRTMVPDAEDRLARLLAADPETLSDFTSSYKLTCDPRVTRVGRLLRRTSLDELPQLWNVLRGEMSIVGPRPIVPEELWRYGSYAALVLQAKPGITGLWQVSGRSNLPYVERVQLDADYVLTHSLMKDLRIVLSTLLTLGRCDGSAR